MCVMTVGETILYLRAADTVVRLHSITVGNEVPGDSIRVLETKYEYYYRYFLS
jgi:hypothetical protein